MRTIISVCRLCGGPSAVPSSISSILHSPRRPRCRPRGTCGPREASGSRPWRSPTRPGAVASPCRSASAGRSAGHPHTRQQHQHQHRQQQRVRLSCPALLHGLSSLPSYGLPLACCCLWPPYLLPTCTYCRFHLQELGSPSDPRSLPGISISTSHTSPPPVFVI